MTRLQILTAAAALALLAAPANAEWGSNKDRGYGGKASAVGNFGSGQGNDRYSLGGTSGSAGLNGPTGTGRSGSFSSGFGGGDHR